MNKNKTLSFLHNYQFLNDEEMLVMAYELTNPNRVYKYTAVDRVIEKVMYERTYVDLKSKAHREEQNYRLLIKVEVREAYTISYKLDVDNAETLNRLYNDYKDYVLSNDLATQELKELLTGGQSK